MSLPTEGQCQQDLTLSTITTSSTADVEELSMGIAIGNAYDRENKTLHGSTSFGIPVQQGNDNLTIVIGTVIITDYTEIIADGNLTVKEAYLALVTSEFLKEILMLESDELYKTFIEKKIENKEKVILWEKIVGENSERIRFVNNLSTEFQDLTNTESLQQTLLLLYNDIFDAENVNQQEDKHFGNSNLKYFLTSLNILSDIVLSYTPSEKEEEIAHTDNNIHENSCNELLPEKMDDEKSNNKVLNKKGTKKDQVPAKSVELQNKKDRKQRNNQSNVPEVLDPQQDKINTITLSEIKSWRKKRAKDEISELIKLGQLTDLKGVNLSTVEIETLHSHLEKYYFPSLTITKIRGMKANHQNPELQTLLERLGLPFEGNKNALVKELSNYYEQRDIDTEEEEAEDDDDVDDDSVPPVVLQNAKSNYRNSTNISSQKIVTSNSSVQKKVMFNFQGLIIITMNFFILLEYRINCFQAEY